MKRFTFQTEVNETTLRDVLGFVTASAIRHFPGRLSVDGWWNTRSDTKRGVMEVIDGIVRFYPAKGSIEGAGRPAAELYHEELTWKFNYFEPEWKYIKTLVTAQLEHRLGTPPEDIAYLPTAPGTTCRCVIDISRWGLTTPDVLEEDITYGYQALVGLLHRHGYEFVHPTNTINIIHVYRSIV